MKLVLGWDFAIRLRAGDSNPLKKIQVEKKQPASNNNKSA
jgi:hypothetical protein